MRLKNISVCCLFLLSMSYHAIAADVTVTPMSPDETSYFMTNLSKIAVDGFYESQSLVFYDEQGAVVAEKPVKVPTKITFGVNPQEGLAEVVESNTAISFYPNPSSDVIHIMGLEKPVTVQLYNLKGQLILSSQSSDIDVSHISAGSYVMQIGSQCFKVLIH